MQIKKNNKQSNLVKQVLETYKIDENKLSEMTGIPKSTISTWKNETVRKISNTGSIVMKLLLENYELRKKDEAIKTLLNLYK